MKVGYYTPSSPVFDWLKNQLRQTATGLAVADQDLWLVPFDPQRSDEKFDLILDWSGCRDLFPRYRAPIYHVFVEAWPAVYPHQRAHNEQVLLASAFQGFVVHSPVLLNAILDVTKVRPHLWTLGVHNPASSQAKHYDIAHYGSDFGARSGFLRRLRPALAARGITFRDLSGTFGTSLTAELLGSRIVLNLEHSPGAVTSATWRFWQAVEADALYVVQQTGFSSQWPADENMMRCVLTGDETLFADVLYDLLNHPTLLRQRTAEAHAFAKSFNPVATFRDLIYRITA